jgi:hypothetical protein
MTQLEELQSIRNAEMHIYEHKFNCNCHRINTLMSYYEMIVVYVFFLEVQTNKYHSINACMKNIITVLAKK